MWLAHPVQFWLVFLLSRKLWCCCHIYFCPSVRRVYENFAFSDYCCPLHCYIPNSHCRKKNNAKTNKLKKIKNKIKKPNAKNTSFVSLFESNMNVRPESRVSLLLVLRWPITGVTTRDLYKQEVSATSLDCCCSKTEQNWAQQNENRPAHFIHICSRTHSYHRR